MTFANNHNPFGVMMNRATYPSVPGLLGTIYGRNLTSIWADAYTGACSTCANIVEGEAGSGLRVLTIRGNGSPGNASTPITNTALIESTVKAVAADFHPSLIVYGNEVNSVTFYTGTAAQYQVELAAAAIAAHEAGLLIANDGPTWDGVVFGAWADLIDASQFTAACDLMEQTQTPADAATICAFTAVNQLPTPYSTYVSKIRALMPVYAAEADIGNFHWYFDQGTDPTSAALETVYNWFKAEIGGKPVIINEFGVRIDSPATLRAIMERMIALEVPTAIYYNLQAQPAFPLNDGAGVLTAIGTEFRDVITENCA